jgi:hypothetical protein
MDMKQILLLFSFLLFTLGALAQSPIKIEPADYKESFSVDLSQIALLQDPSVTITNTTDSTISIRWELFNLNKPTVWESQVCDPNECYIPIVSSNIDTALGINAPIVLAPDSSAKVSIYITPNETVGTGMFAIDFFLASDPYTTIDMATFEVEINNLVVNTITEIKNQAIRLYPNPSPDYFQLTNSEYIDRIIMTNLVGKQVGSFRAFPGKSYDISYLPNGLYAVSLVNDDIGVVKTLRLSKRSFRP